ncbi:hypothetical protein B0A55_05336 [Friedmanniomyces simplex]|uniref:Uncharacterized protein n=1 Tax=Friedmanniomyces simplex TaxID=329884 RepID=A0A4U0XDH6_9PEZI|nr:hypothetical protein B0A55_05336 [Friedmanniomyces simplex]
MDVKLNVRVAVTVVALLPSVSSVQVVLDTAKLEFLSEAVIGDVGNELVTLSVIVTMTAVDSTYVIVSVTGEDELDSQMSKPWKTDTEGADPTLLVVLPAPEKLPFVAEAGRLDVEFVAVTGEPSVEEKEEVEDSSDEYEPYLGWPEKLTVP